MQHTRRHVCLKGLTVADECVVYLDDTNGELLETRESLKFEQLMAMEERIWDECQRTHIWYIARQQQTHKSLSGIW